MALGSMLNIQSLIMAKRKSNPVALPIPIFTREKYDIWSGKMETYFLSHVGFVCRLPLSCLIDGKILQRNFFNHKINETKISSIYISRAHVAFHDLPWPGQPSQIF